MVFYSILLWFFFIVSVILVLYKVTYSLYLHCIYAYTSSNKYNMYLYPRCLEQFTLGLVFDYLLGTFIVHVHVGLSFDTHAYINNKPT